jgi:predicted acyl esterase
MMRSRALVVLNAFHCIFGKRRNVKRSSPVSSKLTSMVFRRRHGIRLTISSSKFPRFDVNPNTGEPLNHNRLWRVADDSVYHDAQHPSRIILPIIPAPRT